MERRLTDVPGLPHGWKREEILRNSGLSAGKSDVIYYSPEGYKIRTKPELARALGNNFDLTCFDFRSGKIVQSAGRKKNRIRGPYDYAGGMRQDVNLSLPIRQTASIFKQPVTVVRNHSTCNKSEANLKHGNQEVPKQLFWEKRLQGLSASDASEQQFASLKLPKLIQGVGPNMTPANLLQSIAAALHTTNQAVTGQTAPPAAMHKNPCVHINAEQPLVMQLNIRDDDVKSQESRVTDARRRLEDAIKEAQQPLEVSS